MENELVKIQVSGIRDSEKSKSIGALVNLKFDEQGNCNSAMDLVWFPKSVCTLEEVEYNRDWFGKIITSKKYFITAPKWFLEKNGINFKNIYNANS